MPDTPTSPTSPTSPASPASVTTERFGALLLEHRHCDWHYEDGQVRLDCGVTVPRPREALAEIHDAHLAAVLTRAGVGFITQKRVEADPPFPSTVTYYVGSQIGNREPVLREWDPHRSLRIARQLVDEYNADEAERVAMELREVRERFFLVKATTTFERVTDPQETS